jgi:VIT1/CCC1 family predicted Fe2+/Mn2+ transporter
MLFKVDMEIGEDLALLEERFRSRGMTSDEARAVARRFWRRRSIEGTASRPRFISMGE